MDEVRSMISDAVTKIAYSRLPAVSATQSAMDTYDYIETAHGVSTGTDDP
jgi:hypothetical protein